MSKWPEPAEIFTKLQCPGPDKPTTTVTAPCGIIPGIPIETEFFQWWVPDERTGKLRKTRHKMTRETAQQRHAGCQPYLPSREVRTVYRSGEAPGNAKPVGR